METSDSASSFPASPLATRPWLSLALLRRVSRALTIAFSAAVMTYLGFEAHVLWHEWRQLRREWHQDVQSRVIGYPQVVPDFSFARPPLNWFHDEEDHTVLWAGWDRRANQHQWFQFAKGDLTPSQLTHPIGRDTVRVIDAPCVETKGGTIWGTIPDENLVAAVNLRGVALAYPFGVLDKVLVVNDSLPRSPLLVVFTPFLDPEHAVSVFDPVLADERLLMGHSGYLCDGQPMLYDRRTESLWVPSGRGLIAVAGPRRGAILPRLTRLSAVAWGTWRAKHPETRLVVGADRSTALAKR